MLKWSSKMNSFDKLTHFRFRKVILNHLTFRRDTFISICYGFGSGLLRYAFRLSISGWIIIMVQIYMITMEIYLFLILITETADKTEFHVLLQHMPMGERTCNKNNPKLSQQIYFPDSFLTSWRKTPVVLQVMNSVGSVSQVSIMREQISPSICLQGGERQPFEKT